MSLYITYFNWKSFYIQNILDEHYDSVLPFLGGIGLFVSSLIYLKDDWKILAVLAFLIDYGSLPFIFHSYLTRNKNYITIFNRKISLISKIQQQKNIIRKHLLIIEKKSLSATFYHIFNDCKNSKDVTFQFNSEVYEKTQSSEINQLLSYLNFLKIGNFEINIDLIEEDNSFINLGYYYSMNKIDMIKIIVDKDNLLLIHKNNNLFSELIIRILIAQYNALSINEFEIVILDKLSDN